MGPSVASWVLFVFSEVGSIRWVGGLDDVGVRRRDGDDGRHDGGNRRRDGGDICRLDRG